MRQHRTKALLTLVVIGALVFALGVPQPKNKIINFGYESIEVAMLKAISVTSQINKMIRETLRDYFPSLDRS